MDKVTDSKHNEYPSIYRKIRWGFGLMTLVMFTLFWSLIYVAENKLEVLSLHHWLDTEAALYQENYKKLGWDAPLPNVLEFDSYWSEAPTPSWMLSFKKPGFYEYLLGSEDKHFVVFDHPSGEGVMYIVFQDDSDDYLDEYESSLHQVTLVLGGMFLLIIMAYSIYMVRSLSRPLSQIEDKIGKMPPDQPVFQIDTKFSETRHIEQTLLSSKVDIAAFFRREQEFSRFASHELRTPIMIIQGSTDILAKVPDQPRVAKKAIARMQSACEEMRILTEAFLLLGKEKVESQHYGEHALIHCLSHQLNELAPLFARQDSSYVLSEVQSGVVYAPESFVTIVINNLIKNAFSYSIGDIEIDLNGTRLTIANRHDGNETYNAGYGCGLVIVQRICERMNWSFSLEDDGIKFTAIVDFTKQS
ncbi:His Kinase A (phosphoacceptor) domain [Vibrio sp. B1REV9]|uniref:sensor histidine kinase n=1 Tax=Vibrio sp. B1REV9 TaxID=2751179 RepID=UPI001AF9EE2D|nr:HAMP domain-containing sensor histidine kinase [Vibrio sp. B1REV9]CAE6923317.1 His Kinase A (phosphoacceptor) domain [Vibrio sp. B1REV9]